MKSKGFTLIELVMVIVIIGILAAVAIPRFANLRSEARKAACLGNEGALRGALSAYYAKAAVSAGWAGGSSNSASGFPRALTGTTFLTLLVGGTLPNCPLTGSSAIYATNDYTSATGVLAEHTAAH